MKRMPQPIPYQGSKRNIAKRILALVPDKLDMLVEPFAGSAAVSIRAAYMNKAERFYLNDLNKPLMDLLDLIINEPDQISSDYEQLWQKQLGQERQFYDDVRAEFNATGRPELFLYLLARCVKASVRYNSDGQFNQAPDNRRKGRHPDSMRDEIHAVSALLKGKVKISSQDFSTLTNCLSPHSDIIYMDPPYQGTSKGRDSRYYSGIAMSELVDFISKLNAENIMFILSYDGRKGSKVYGRTLPNDLGLIRVEIEAGRSTQSTLLGKQDVTYESLYLSLALVERLQMSPSEIDAIINPNPIEKQLQLTFA